LILSKTDHSAAEYFVREYLKIKDISYIVDQDQYASLVQDKNNLQIKLYEDSGLIFQMPIKELSARIDELNRFAADTNTGKFSFKNFNEINQNIKTKFFGNTDKFILKEYLALYSKLSGWLIYSNLKLNTMGSIRLTDSLMASIVYTPAQLKQIQSKREFYQQHIEGLMESKISAFAYFRDRIYLTFTMIDYDKMPAIEQVSEDKPVYLVQQEYLIEMDVNGNKLSVLRIKNLKKDCEKCEFQTRFSILDDEVALFFKTKEGKNEIYQYYHLMHEWNKRISMQKQTSMMSPYILENIFMNQYTHNYDRNILIDNKTGVYIKMHPSQMSDNILTGSSIFINKEFAFYNVLNRIENKHWIYRVNLSTKQVDVIRSYTELNTQPFGPMFYFEEASGKLHIIDINDDKNFYIIESIQL